MTTRSTAWQSLAGALPAGTPALAEIIILDVHGYFTLKFRNRASADAVHKALAGSLLLHTGSKSKGMKAKAIRVKCPAVRRRGIALSPYCQAVESAFPDVEITQKHKTRGRSSATAFFVDSADIDKDDFIAVATVLWTDNGTVVEILACEPALGPPKSLVASLKELSS